MSSRNTTRTSIVGASNATPGAATLATALGSPPRKPQSISSPGNDPGARRSGPQRHLAHGTGIGSSDRAERPDHAGIHRDRVHGAGAPGTPAHLSGCAGNGWAPRRYLCRETVQRAVDDAYAGRRTAGGHPGCAAYVDFLDLLVRYDIDAVVIALGRPLALRGHGDGGRGR